MATRKRRSRQEKQEVTRVSMALDPSLLARFDALVGRRGYATRSEALRDLIRDELVHQQWSDNREVVGSITLLYDHHTPGLGAQLTRQQHDAEADVLSALHVHLDHDHCLEVIVVRGPGKKVQKLADALISVRGVLHGQLTSTSLGQKIR